VPQKTCIKFTQIYLGDSVYIGRTCTHDGTVLSYHSYISDRKNETVVYPDDPAFNLFAEDFKMYSL
jgi:hypothetical protein